MCQQYGVEWRELAQTPLSQDDMFARATELLRLVPDDCASLRVEILERIAGLEPNLRFGASDQLDEEQLVRERERQLQEQLRQQQAARSHAERALAEAEWARLARERAAASAQLPSFPWPPPTPSEQMVLRRSLVLTALPSNPSLFDVGEHFRTALEESGYSEIGFYNAPGGFAIISRLERIESDGRPAPGDFRYMPPGQEPFSLAAYLTSLFVAPEGRYRVIAFVVTNTTFSATGEAISANEARTLLRRAANRLPDYFRELPFEQGHEVTALIYEFERPANSQGLRLLPESRLSARTHLERSGIYSALSRRSPP